MASETSIINSSLRKLGEVRISSRIDGTPTAEAVNDLFDDIRDELLRSHPWNFATARAQLSKGATPISGFDNQFLVPADWLRTLEVQNNKNGYGTAIYKMESHATDKNVILSDADELYLRYVRRVTDANIMTPDFREAFSYRLAADLALPVANSNTLRQPMEDAFVKAFRQARSVDSIEDFPDSMPEGSWIRARRGGNQRGRWPDVLES